MELLWSNTEVLKQLKETLDQDEIILASGDTVLGLYAQLTPVGYEKLNTIKNRSGKPILIVISDKDKLSYFTDQDMSEAVQKIINYVWPGPVTLIFKAKKSLPHYMKEASGTIALRIPDHEGLRSLLHFYPGLFSTSANLHAEPIPERLTEINEVIKEKVKVACFDEGKQDYGQTPSTILDCTTDQIKVIREGGIQWDSLKSRLNL